MQTTEVQMHVIESSAKRQIKYPFAERRKYRERRTLKNEEIPVAMLVMFRRDQRRFYGGFRSPLPELFRERTNTVKTRM